MTIKERLARIKFFPVTPDLSHLTRDEQVALRQCIAAGRVCSDLYLMQAGHGNVGIHNWLALSGGEERRDVLKYFLVHGQPWDRFANREPFVPGVGPRSEPYSGSYYPADLAPSEWEAWLKSHPQDHAALKSYHTVIERRDGKLVPVPYADVYRRQLSNMTAYLRSAARALPSGPLLHFLVSRALAFQTNEYQGSEVDWIHTDGEPFELTIGPYEQYLDGLSGVKTAFTALIGLPDRELTAMTKQFLPVMAQINTEIAQTLGFTPTGSLCTVVVVNDVFRGGEYAHGGTQVMAYCLPNDREIIRRVGSKRVISKTGIQAKTDYISRPIAEQVLPPAHLATYSTRCRILYVLAHELAHGLGPTMVTQSDGSEIGFDIALGEIHSPIEETKADALAAVLLARACRDGVIDDHTLTGCLVGEVADWVRQWRKGLRGAHAQGAMIQYNWCYDYGAVRYEGNQFMIEPEMMVMAMSSLATALMRLEQKGDRLEAEGFAQAWSAPRAELEGIDKRFDNLPIDVYPEFQIRW